MREAASWQATKYALGSDGTLHASSDAAFVSPASRLNVELLAREIGRTLRQHGRGRLLDLGCGAAPLFAVYRSIADEILCVDWPSSDHGLRHIDTSCDLNQKLPFGDSEFDTVLLTDVLEHLEQPALALDEIARILTPGGCLIGTVPFMYWLHEQPHDNYRFTEHALRRLANQAGLTVEELSPYGAGPDVMFDLLGKLLIEIHWRLGPWLAGMSGRIGLLLHDHMGVAGLQRWRHVPLGYSFVFRR